MKIYSGVRVVCVACQGQGRRGSSRLVGRDPRVWSPASRPYFAAAPHGYLDGTVQRHVCVWAIKEPGYFIGRNLVVMYELCSLKELVQLYSKESTSVTRRREGCGDYQQGT